MAQDTSLMSMDYQDTSVISSADISEVTHFVLIGQKLRENTDLHHALQVMGAEISYSDTGMDDTLNQPDVAPIVENFQGSIFTTLLKHKRQIFAPPAIFKFANMEGFPKISRPTYCLSMEGITVCFNGFKCLNALKSASFMVRSMNGIVAKDVLASVTHLVSLGTRGEKYKLAVSKGLPIMTINWVEKCWEQRDDPYFKAEDLSPLQYKLSPFVSSVLRFYGFSKEDEKHMKELAITNGGEVAVENGKATHLVVNEREVSSLPLSVARNVHVVKSEWFWASIQIEALATECLYLFQESCETPRPARDRRTPSTPLSNSNKRKRGRESYNRCAIEEEMSSPPGKRSSLDVLGKVVAISLNVNETSPIMIDEAPTDTADRSATPPDLSMSASNLASLTKRQCCILELYDTENKFVSILDLIVNTIQPALENPNQPGGALLTPLEVKNIFTGLTPIYKLHSVIRKKMLKVVTAWDQNLSVGEIFIAHLDEMSKIYPQFVNFLDKTKKEIALYEKKYPRFLAFLKVCQSRKEFNREHFSELLIRPVQRLPSTKLLLEIILKKTEETHNDYKPLKNCIERLNNVIKSIDNEKRTSENYLLMFRLEQEIDGFPVTLVSNNRVLYMKAELNLVDGSILGSDTDKLMMLIFDNSIEICKKCCPNLRTSSVSISQLSMGGRDGGRSSKPYVHVASIPHSSIKRVVEILGVKGYQSFSLVFEQDSMETMYTFTISNKRPPMIEPSCGLKQEANFDFLTFLTGIISTNSRVKDDELLAAVNYENISINKSRFVKSSIMRTASKITRNLTRVFAHNKTPLKRTISQISNVLSPLRRDNSVSIMGTPTNQNSSTMFSDFIDRMKQEGTPSLQRRRDTLAAGVATVENPQRSQANNSHIFLTPNPVMSHGRRNNQLASINLNRDFPSMQLLEFDPNVQNENIQPDQIAKPQDRA